MALTPLEAAVRRKKSQPALPTFPPLPDRSWVAAVDMGASNLRFARADARGRITLGTAERVRPEAGPAGVIAQIKAGIERLGRPSGSAGGRASKTSLAAI